MGNKTLKRKRSSKKMESHSISSLSIPFDLDQPLSCKKNLPLAKSLPDILAIDCLNLNIFSNLFGKGKIYRNNNFHMLFGTNKFNRNIECYNINLINNEEKALFSERSVIFDIINYIVLGQTGKICLNKRFIYYTAKFNCKFEVLLSIKSTEQSLEDQLEDILFNIYTSFTITEGTAAKLLSSVDFLIPSHETTISLPLIIIPKELGLPDEEFQDFKAKIYNQLNILFDKLSRRFQMINIEFKLESSDEIYNSVCINDILLQLAEQISEFRFFACSFWVEDTVPTGEYSLYDTIYKTFIKNQRLCDCALSTHYSAIKMEDSLRTEEIYDYILYNRPLAFRMYSLLFCLKKSAKLKKLRKKRKIQLTILEMCVDTENLYKKGRKDYSRNHVSNQRVVPVSFGTGDSEVMFYQK